VQESLDQQQFTEIYRATLPDISRFIARRCPASEVEDIAADLYEIAWSKRKSIPSGLEFAWLIKTARYLISNRNRKQNNRGRILGLLEDPVAAPSAESIALADLELADAWKRLPERDREVLALWAFEGLEGEHLGQALEVSAGAAAVRLSRARQRLQETLAEFK
jgi:RNA polymerase sigma factor (sigma-70 family)